MFEILQQRLRNALRIVSASTLLYVVSMTSMDYYSMVEWAASVRSQDEWDIRCQILPHTLLTYADRLYLASYTTPPTADTLFPYPDPQPSRRSPTKRSARAVDGPAAVSQRERSPPYYFSIDDTLLYNAFHHDFGPLHIGHLYRFAVQFHDILGAPENKDKPVVFWSKADARSE
jgi:cell division cycle 14